MEILEALRSRVVAVNDSLESGGIIRDVLEPREGDIMELQQIQLLEGKRPDGDDIRPYYSEDIQPSGYFKSKESAARYAAWKGTLNYPYSVERNPDAPNLYINGRFHSELGVVFDTEDLAIIGVTPYARNIMAGYGLDSFGLSPQKWQVVFQERGAYYDLMDKIKTMLYVS